MTTRGRWLVTASGAVGFAWAGLQLFLTHRLAAQFYSRSIGDCARFVHQHPTGQCYPLSRVTEADWLPYAAASIAVLVALAGVAALLVRGGRRWWSLVVVALPAANFFGGWEDGRLLGAGWIQLSSGTSLTKMIVAGTVIDTAVVAMIATALALTIRPGISKPRSTAELLRAVPPVIVLAGWWLMRHPMPGRTDDIWLMQASAFVLVAALLSTSGLQPWLRAAGTLVVLPLCTLPVYSEAVGFGTFADVVHHALVALATASWMLGVPWLAQRWRRPQTSLDPVGAAS